MIILPQVFKFNGLDVVTKGISVATGGENGRPIMSIASK